MNFIVWIIFGGLAGWIASMIAGTNEEQGLLANIVVGVIGAFIGGFIMGKLDKPGVTGFNLRSFIVAVLGAVLLLILFRIIF
ncbi:GlsB/YeaQ/YmgE family stress response membrane protein [Candidatus Dojkabacteria bacterium]|uniref:GlsB/YeaQ/YmgE family stress response membrane protein n=1 Tax=Candidatus Dojkabacteria bacterium TaxID=2099670 RepID=A0A5C7J449_9BACT|nr:MAG: GlsB/YeaQ/YmgE family stress response membrane protein [Candidatus Dojkabacteria bacterium]